MKQTGWYIAVFAASNFVGALLLGPLFDTVGRVRMITGDLRHLRACCSASPGFMLGGLHRGDPDR